MKTLLLFVVFSIMSCVVMAVVNYCFGPRAEFINTYGALERFSGQNSSAGKSYVAMEYGDSGELLGFPIVSLPGGCISTILAKAMWRA